MVRAKHHHPAIRGGGGPVGAVAARLGAALKRTKLQAVKVLDEIVVRRESRFHRCGRAHHQIVNGPPPVVVALMIPRDDRRVGARRVVHVKNDRLVVGGRAVGRQRD